MPGIPRELARRLRLGPQKPSLRVAFFPGRLNITPRAPETSGLRGPLVSLASRRPRSDLMAYAVPPLPYEYDALEPHIDEQTMRIHHDKHHQAYVDKVNAALEGTDWADRPDRGGPRQPRPDPGRQAHGRAEQRRRPPQPHALLGEHEPRTAAAPRTATSPPRSTRRSAPSPTSRASSRTPASTSSAPAGPGSSSTAARSRSSRRRTRTTPSPTARRRSSASTSGSTPTTSRTRTAGPTTSTPGGTRSTGAASPIATLRRRCPRSRSSSSP